MSRYIRGRLLATIPVLFGVSILVFFTLHWTPGDPVAIRFGSVGGGSKELMDALRAQYGLDRPVYVQYYRFISNVFRGNLGISYFQNRAVTKIIGELLPTTVQLALSSLIVAVTFGVILGMIAGFKQNSWIDTLTMILALVGVCVPGFWMGLILIMVFSFALGWFPASGAGTLRHLVLPTLTLGLGEGAVLARLTRSSVVEVLRQDYVRTARAKGLRERVVLYRHVLKNALIPVVTVAGVTFAALLGGVVAIEMVFSRPGLGRLAAVSVLEKDYFVVQGLVLLIAFAYCMSNLAVDLLYTWLDPRIRYD